MMRWRVKSVESVLQCRMCVSVAGASSAASIASIQRNLLQRSQLRASESSATTNADPAKSTTGPRPFVPLKDVLFGPTTVPGGIEGIVTSSIGAMLSPPKSSTAQLTLTQHVLRWVTSCLSARPAHHRIVLQSDNTEVLPLVTALCELEKDVFSSAREHRGSSIYKASLDKAATTMENARSIHQELSYAIQARFLELEKDLPEVDVVERQRLKLSKKLLLDVLMPLYEARLAALSSDFVGFMEYFNNVCRALDEVMLESHVATERGPAADSVPKIPLVELLIDNNIRGNATIISNTIMRAPEYFSSSTSAGKSGKYQIPADETVAITLTPVAAAAKASLLAPATNVLVVLYADKQNINHNIRGILRKHQQLKEASSGSSKTPGAAASSSSPGGPTLSVSAANAPTLKMPSWASKPPSSPQPPPAALSPETVLKVASSTQVLPHTLTLSTVDREAIVLANSLAYPHATADDENATDIHGNKKKKLTPEEAKKRQLEIAEENKFLQHAPSLELITSVIAKAYGANSYTFNTSHKTHYMMTVVVPMGIRFLKGDLPFLLTTVAEEAKAAKNGGSGKKNESDDLLKKRDIKLDGAPNFPHFLDMRHSTSSTSPWHSTFTVFSSRPLVLTHHPQHEAAAGVSALSKDDFGFLLGLLFPTVLGFILGVYIMMNLGKGVLWGAQWLIDEGAKIGTGKSLATTSSTPDASKNGEPQSAAVVSSSVSVSASSLTAAFDDEKVSKK